MDRGVDRGRGSRRGGTAHRLATPEREGEERPMRAGLIACEGAEARLLDDADESLLSGDVELDVLYSSYNYKGGMAIGGQGIARAHPLIPGIDLVGRVTASAEEQFSAGDLEIGRAHV